MFKAAIERGESDARISYPEREQARRAASMFNGENSSLQHSAHYQPNNADWNNQTALPDDYQSH